MIKVNVVNKSMEGRVVAEIEVAPGATLDADTIRHGIKRIGANHGVPDNREIRDGVQMYCTRSGSPLYFQAQDGELVAAMPGSIRIGQEA